MASARIPLGAAQEAPIGAVQCEHPDCSATSLPPKAVAVIKPVPQPMPQDAQSSGVANTINAQSAAASSGAASSSELSSASGGAASPQEDDELESTRGTALERALHFLPFQDAWRMQTDLRVLAAVIAQPKESDQQRHHRYQLVRDVVRCCSCKRLRCVFAQKQLTATQREALNVFLDPANQAWACGQVLIPRTDAAQTPSAATEVAAANAASAHAGSSGGAASTALLGARVQGVKEEREKREKEREVSELTLSFLKIFN